MSIVISESIMGTELPCTASHEGVGTVVKLGSSVQDFKVGDHILCGLIYHRYSACTDCIGPERDHSLLFSPFFFLFRAHADSEILQWGGLVRAGLNIGESIAIVGSGGGLGHLGVQFAKALGLFVIAIDARDEGLQLAKGCGAGTVVDARQRRKRRWRKLRR
jgi:propanol-preferring alcohol dehydrogenase